MLVEVLLVEIMLVEVMLVEVMDFYPLFVDRQISKPRIDPPARVVVVNAILLDVNGFVSMPAENAAGAVLRRVGQRARCHFRRHAQPSRVQAVNQSRDRLTLEVHLLQPQIKRRTPPAEPDAVHLKAVELVAVNRNVPQTAIFPRVALVNANPNQVRHDVGQPVIVIAFYPDNLDVALGIRKLANVAKKLPMFFGQAREVEIGKNVAQQNQPPKPILLEHTRRLARVAGLRAQVQVGKDQRVVPVQIHTPVVAAECYGLMNTASILVHRVTTVVTLNLQMRHPERSRFSGGATSLP
jgi:hypothetical protein